MYYYLLDFYVVVNSQLQDLNLILERYMNLIKIDNICLPVNKLYLQEFTNYEKKKKKQKKQKKKTKQNKTNKLVLKIKLHHYKHMQ